MLWGVFLCAVLLWKAIDAKECVTAYSQPGLALRGHTNETLPMLDYTACYARCTTTPACFSTNFNAKTDECELNSATHLSNPEDLVPIPGYTYTLNSGRRLGMCDDRFCSQGLSCIVNNDGASYSCKACNSPLGMEDSRIPNDRINATSSYSRGYLPWRGRLNNQPKMPYVSSEDAACWVPSKRIPGEYLQIDLGRVMVVTKVATQGRPNYRDEWVTSYNIASSADGSLWVLCPQVFSGNSDKNTVVTHVLQQKIEARYIRFLLNTWNYWPALRVELYGCSSP